jgi:hypothetical protein
MSFSLIKTFISPQAFAVFMTEMTKENSKILYDSGKDKFKFCIFFKSGSAAPPVKVKKMNRQRSSQALEYQYIQFFSSRKNSMWK